MAGIGPAPKPASKRRRYNKPATYGAAEPITAPAASARTVSSVSRIRIGLSSTCGRHYRVPRRPGSTPRPIGSGSAGSCGTPAWCWPAT